MFITSITEEPLSDITLIYGPAGSGKTTACLEALTGRAAYISTSKNFNLERLQKLRSDAAVIIKKIMLFEPQDILELEKAVQAVVKLSTMTDIIIIDSIATLIRSADRKLANLALHRILATLEEVHCPVLMTSEVYDYFSEGRYEFIGGDMLRLASRTIIELGDNHATIKKHPILTGRTWMYQITDTGITKT